MITEHRRVYREPRKCNHQQSSSHQTQPRMRHAMEQPTEGSALERPAKREPLAIKLNGENQGNEEQRRATKQCELRIYRRTFRWRGFQKNHEPEQRWHCKHSGYQAENAVWISGADHVTNEEEM